MGAQAKNQNNRENHQRAGLRNSQTRQQSETKFASMWIVDKIRKNVCKKFVKLSVDNELSAVK